MSSSRLPSGDHLRPGFVLIVIVVATQALAACSSRQLYGAGQAWKQNECNRIMDVQERNRCTASNQTSYEDYQRQTEAAKGSR